MALTAAFALAAMVLTVPALARTAQRALPGDVPTPSATETVVTVRTGGDRISPSAVGPLAGVTLGLFTDADGTVPVDEDWARCVSDADGDCSFVVPDTGEGGENNGAVYYVAQIAAPSGWYTNPVLRTGPGSGSSSTQTRYVFETPPMAGGETYRSTRDFMYETSTSTLKTSLGVWQSSRDNPPLPARCGLRVAVLLDLSSSVGSALPDLKAATDTFADSLVGTPSQMAVFSFSRTSPSAGGANHPELVPVSTQEGADAFKAQYADWAISSGTNWDAGLWAVASAAPEYDVAIVLTDGNPTYYGTSSGSGGTTRVASMEAAIFSANALKAEGTRVVAMGVGSGVQGVSALNLRAASGPTAYNGTNVATADYFQTTEYAEAGEALRELALAQCKGSVSVVKLIAPPETTGEDVTGAEPAGPGWTFDAEPASADTQVSPPSATTVDDGSGTVSFEVASTTPTASVTLTETQHEDHDLVTQGGRNAVCRDLATGDPVTVANTGALGFTVDVPQDTAVSCEVYNRPSGTASVTLRKTWVIDGTAYRDGRQPDGFSAEATLTGPGDLPASEQPFGEPREGYTVGDDITLNEEVEVPAGCALTSREVTRINGETVGHSLPYTTQVRTQSDVFRFTNTVECDEDSDPALKITKHADPDHVKPGGTVTYTVVATNVGDGDFTEANPAGFSDDLRDVLRGASYNNDATAMPWGTVSYDAPILSWSGPLPAGESVVVEYSVTVRPHLKRPVKLCNRVSSSDGTPAARTCVEVHPKCKHHRPGPCCCPKPCCRPQPCHRPKPCGDHKKHPRHCGQAGRPYDRVEPPRRVAKPRKFRHRDQ
ncbi:hypothetical protein [Actinocorallia libanotica]|uniref:VWFA domain-containing protein n=1 Tax=Actinocorallia libanotica TaxID=46162 RepID=A0ABP4C6I6_9ACTN